MSREMLVCHFHADEGIRGTATGDADGSFEYICTRTNGHPGPGAYTWLMVPEPPDLAGADGIAAQYGLHTELPAAIAQFAGRWVEYGVVEHAYATAHPHDFAELLKRYGHTEIKAARYTVSSFLAKTLGDLSRYGSVNYHGGPATGRWSYNHGISWWSVGEPLAWEQRLSWEDTGHDMSYVTD